MSFYKYGANVFAKEEDVSINCSEAYEINTNHLNLAIT